MAVVSPSEPAPALHGSQHSQAHDYNSGSSRGPRRKEPATLGVPEPSSCRLPNSQKAPGSQKS